MNLFDPAGHRLYLAADERAAFLEAAKTAPREVEAMTGGIEEVHATLRMDWY